ncbi:MAG: hypothetical protein ACJ764_08290 [Solirubrobacteraceae bacterium]
MRQVGVRIAILLSLAGATLGGVALARSSPSRVSFSGPLIDSTHMGAISFRGVLGSGRVTKVVHFGWSDVPIACDQGNFHLVAQHFDFAMPVKRSRDPTQNRVFQGRARAHTGAGRTGKFSWFVVGHFNGRFTKAQGNFQARGDYSAQATDCDTGELRWTAKRS